MAPRHQSSFPGPAALGRGAVVTPHTSVPEDCAGWPKVEIDEAGLVHPAGPTAELGALWLARRPVLVVLAVDAARLRDPETHAGPLWALDPGFEFSRERLQYLVWSNNYDCRGPEPIWWHARRAERLGASAGGPADVVLADGTPAWCDGGPRQPLDPDGLRLPGTGLGPIAVVHRHSIELASLRPDRPLPLDGGTEPGEPAAGEDDPGPGQNRAAFAGGVLAPDQLAAVSHSHGSARVIAPAGSGKTRVLTERLRHLLADRQVTSATVAAVAFNKRAADEMAQRCAGLGANIRTVHSLALAIVNSSGPFVNDGSRYRRVISEVEVRTILERLTEVRRQRNVDPYAAYLDGFSAIRMGLRNPAQVQEDFPDAADLARVFDQYRRVLSEEGLVDFDEQIYRAIEILLSDPVARAHNQLRCRHLLVDEFQDLTPATLLLLRLLAAPTYDVFGVGDDDQVIYSYAGADPKFLIDYGRYFPGARNYALTVNYRCPPPVVRAAGLLLSNNRRRVVKQISLPPGSSHANGPGPDANGSDRSGPDTNGPDANGSDRSGPDTNGPDANGPDANGSDAATGLCIEKVPAQAQAAAVARHLAHWRSAGLDWSEMAVLARVNAGLMATQVTLVSQEIPCWAPLGPGVLGRTGIRCALAYLRLAANPARMSRSDLAETIRRPSRRLSRAATDALTRRAHSSLAEVSRLAGRLSGTDSSRLSGFVEDLEAVAEALAAGGTPGGLRAIRVQVGLGRLMDTLDGSRAGSERSSHADDLLALEQVAGLHPEASTFEVWLNEHLAASGDESGVALSSVHRVKGREWPLVIVAGVGAESFPHRLSAPGGFNRPLGGAAADLSADPSRELEEERRIFHVALTRASRHAVILADASAPSPYCAEMEGRIPPPSGASSRASGRSTGATPMASGAPGGVTAVGPMASRAPVQAGPRAGAEAVRALKVWRLSTASREGVPAYVVLSDAQIEGIVQEAPRSLVSLARCRGIGPVKLDRYGDEILSVLEAAM
ncbi:MAG: ATP-dependent helicase [Acidimicrobiales bacterium]